MKEYYIEIFRPAYPEKGIYTRVHDAKTFTMDQLNPGATTLIHVSHVGTKDAAVALALESGLGSYRGGCVSTIFPRKAA
jgi:hypothetical protein